jgi:hypothetical protein
MAPNLSRRIIKGANAAPPWYNAIIFLIVAP